MDGGPGVELPRRTAVMWLLVAFAVIFLVPSGRMVRMAMGESGMPRLLLVWGMTGAIILVAVVLPLLIARSMRHGRTFVSAEAVTQTRGEVIRKQIRFEELVEIRARSNGRMGGVPSESVTLIAADTHGKRRGMHVSRVFVTSLQPLLARLEREVERRPELLANPHERELFQAALVEAD